MSNQKEKWIHTFLTVADHPNVEMSQRSERSRVTPCRTKGTTVSALCFHKPVAACTVTHMEPDTADNYDMACLDAIGAGQARTWK